MKLWEWIGLGVAGYFGYTLWQKYEAGSNLQVSIQGVDLSSFPNINLTLGILNVTNTPLTIVSVGGNVQVNGAPLGSFSNTTPVTIAPNVSTPFPISFSTSLLGLPDAIAQVVNNLGGSITAQITGVANVTGIPVPVPINTTQTFNT